MRFPNLHFSRSSILTVSSWVVYLLLLLLAIPPVLPWIHRTIFLLYAIFVFWILYPTLKKGGNKANDGQETAFTNRHLWIALLAFAGLFLLASRLIMFIRYGVTPLGYDTGFYWQYFNLITPNGTSAGYVGASTSIAYTPWFPYYYLGLSAIPVINFLHVLHQLLTAGALYFLVRSFRSSISLLPTLAVTLFLFALSINQFMAFWWMFFKQSMALPFLLLATGLFLRKSWLAIPIVAIGTAMHPQSAIPFGIAFILFLLYQIGVCIVKKRALDRELLYMGMSGFIAGLLLVILKSPKGLLAYIEYFNIYGGLANNARSWEVQQVKGLFLPFDTFRLNTLFYLPFAITGILTMRSWLFNKVQNIRLSIIPIILLVSLILGSFPFLYQNRMLIILDIMLLLFAAYPITAFVKQFLNYRTGNIILGLLGIGFILFAGRVVWNHPPQIYAEEAREIEKIAQLRKSDDFAMSISSIYTPWVFAYNKFEPTIVPGWLHWDRWNLAMWEVFWNGNSDRRRLELLSMYGDHDIYMFAGRHFTLSDNLKKFLETDPHITKISPHVWKYSPLLSPITMIP